MTPKKTQKNAKILPSSLSLRAGKEGRVFLLKPKVFWSTTSIFCHLYRKTVLGGLRKFRAKKNANFTNLHKNRVFSTKIEGKKCKNRKIEGKNPIFPFPAAAPVLEGEIFKNAIYTYFPICFFVIFWPLFLCSPSISAPPRERRKSEKVSYQIPLVFFFREKIRTKKSKNRRRNFPI